MITLKHPILSSFLKTPIAPKEIIVDWLNDINITIKDMVLLFRGNTPSYQDGIPKDVLSLWLKQQGKEKDSALVNGHSISTITDGISNTRIYYYVNYVNPDGSFSTIPVDTFNDANIKLKRYILNLPWAKDIEVESEYYIDMKDFKWTPSPKGLEVMRETILYLRDQGFKFGISYIIREDWNNHRVIFTQILKGSELL